MRSIFHFVPAFVISGLATTVAATAQTYYANYIPATFYEGDTISLSFYFPGTPENPVSFNDSLHLVHNYADEIALISSESDLSVQLASGWGCQGNCTPDVWIDHENQEIHVLITFHEAIEGYGQIATVRGIIVIEIEPPHNRLASPDGFLTETSIQIYPNPASSYLTIAVAEGAIGDVDILSMEGRLIRTVSASEKKIKLSIADQEPGIYFFRFRSLGITRMVQFN
ncbi:MAG: T9SS type A sorting domain-containing protein [Bacteroidia bacterium]